jgi:hypothetical protein
VATDRQSVRPVSRDPDVTDQINRQHVRKRLRHEWPAQPANPHVVMISHPSVAANLIEKAASATAK